MTKRKPAPQPDIELAGAELDAMHVKTVAVESLRDDPNNVREHNPRNIEAIAASLSEFGQQKPIVIDGDGVIVAGHGTVMAARALGWPRIAVVVSKLEGARKEAFAIADNRTGELSFFDESKLLDRLERLDASDLVIGFNAAELADMQAGEPVELPAMSPDDDKRAPSARTGERQAIVTATLAVKSADLFERAVAATGLLNREDALAAICSAYLAHRKTAGIGLKSNMPNSESLD